MAADVDAAIAAKDARITELEAQLREMYRMHSDIGEFKKRRALLKCDTKIKNDPRFLIWMRDLAKNIDTIEGNEFHLEIVDLWEGVE
jgi:hypothetical protein